MVLKSDIATEKLADWDKFKDKVPEEVVEAIYTHISETSLEICGWYWKSIKTKRLTSLFARGIVFLLLASGTTLPIFAAIQETAEKKVKESSQPGALEVTVKHTGEPTRLKISVDNGKEVEFLGHIWSNNNLSPGLHKIRLNTASVPPLTIERIAEIKANSITNIEVTIGE